MPLRWWHSLKNRFSFNSLSSVQFSCSVVSNSLRPHGLQHTRPPCLSPTPGVYPNSCANEFTQLIELVMPSNHLILCHALLLTPSIFPSIKVFSNGLALCIRCPRYWTLNFSIRPLDKYSEFDLLAIQGSLKSLLQDNSSKSSIQRSDFFIV